jgi:hypothetical protein
LQTDEETIDILLAEHFRGDGTLTHQRVGLINAFRQEVFKFVKEHYAHRKTYQEQHNQLMDLIKKVNQARSIVMNPGAHQGDLPIYEQELIEALNNLKELESKLKQKT